MALATRTIKPTIPSKISAVTAGSEFEDAAVLTFGVDVEGGYVNDLDDPGGETKFGISKRAYPNEDIKNLTIERAKFLGKRDYWYPMRLDAINCQMVSNNLFDFSFHHGVRGVVKKLQFVLAKHFDFNGDVDGILGGQTVDFVNSVIQSGDAGAFALHQALMKSRLEYYLAYAQPKYLEGFITRATRFL